MEINFIGGAYRGRSSNINAQTCMNYMPAIDVKGGKTQMFLMGTPGTKLWVDTGSEKQARGAVKWDGYLYAVFGSTLYKIDKNKNVTSVGTMGTTTGKVFLAGGTTHLCLTDGLKGYYQTASATSLTEITDTDFPVPSSLCYESGFFIVTRSGTDEFYISDSEDASSWNGLNFASAEDQPDDILLGHVYKRHLINFGKDSIEIFYNVGDPTFPYTRVAGAILTMGLGSMESVASGVEGLFFLDNNYQIRLFEGYETRTISTPQIDYQIRQYEDQENAIGLTYTQEGQSFYQLTFPLDHATWCYDVTTGEWHTRSTGTRHRRHIANWHEWFAGKNLVAHHSNGKIYELDLDTYTDDGNTIISERTSQPVMHGRKNVIHNRLEIEFEAGVGNSNVTDPQAMLEWSDDGAHTWSNRVLRPIGKAGTWKNRSIWNSLGSSRARIYKLIQSDATKRIVIGADLEYELGLN